jgi:hypothetical protein
MARRRGNALFLLVEHERELEANLVLNNLAGLHGDLLIGHPCTGDAADGLAGTLDAISDGIVKAGLLLSTVAPNDRCKNSGLPTSYADQAKVVGPLGFEPRTKGFTLPRSFLRAWTISSPSASCRSGAGR